MEYKRVTADRYDDVIQHLRRNFFCEEPLNNAVGLCTDSESGNSDLEKHSTDTLADGLSLMAVTSENEIAGVILNGVLRPGDLERSRKKLELCSDENFKKIFILLYEQNLKIDWFSIFNDIDKAFDIRILSVDSKFRGYGIGKELILKSEELAKEFGFKLIKADATGYFSQKIFHSLNFEKLSELYYKDYVDDFGNPILSVKLPHEKLELLYKIISD